MYDSECYAQLSLHRWMLRDSIRNESYRHALNHAVKPGDAVLDMGAGTGLLSMFAAHAGASEVFAIERTGIAKFALKMIDDNGLSDRIKVMQTDLEDANLPRKVDVLVSEWMGGLGVDENMLAPLVMARDRHLAPGGRIVPASVTAVVAPAFVEEIASQQTLWNSKPHGIDMSAIAHSAADEAYMSQARIVAGDLRAAPQAMWTHDAMTATLEQADSPFVAKLRFVVDNAGVVSALAAWFTADMGDGTTLTNAVGSPDTHWGRMLLPLTNPVKVAVGDVIEAEVHCVPSVPGSCEFSWNVQITGQPNQAHDTRRVGKL
jgi:cyclopropane fatty-acyl-phospholipid synthase-like methyltransferase